MSSAHFSLEVFTHRAQDPALSLPGSPAGPFPKSAPQNTLKTVLYSKDEATEGAVSPGLHHTPAKRTSFSKDLNKSIVLILQRNPHQSKRKQELLDTSVFVYKNIRGN